jgi:hypothetical protein
MRLDRAAGQVVPEQRVGERVVGEVPGRGDGPGDLADDRAVAVAVRPGDDPVVDPGELLPAVVQALLGDLAGNASSSRPSQGNSGVGMTRRQPAEVDFATAELGGAEVGRAAGEVGMKEADPAAGELGVAEADLVGGTGCRLISRNLWQPHDT